MYVGMHVGMWTMKGIVVYMHKYIYVYALKGSETCDQ
jgi:hypothetical protein